MDGKETDLWLKTVIPPALFAAVFAAGFAVCYSENAEETGASTPDIQHTSEIGIAR